MTETYPRQTPRRRPPSRFFPVEAEEMLRSGDVENAAELCKHGLVYFPENISGYAVLARAYLVLDQEHRAFNVLEAGYRRTGAEGLRSVHLFLQEEKQQAPAEATPAQAEPTVATTDVEQDQEAEQPQNSISTQEELLEEPDENTLHVAEQIEQDTQTEVPLAEDSNIQEAVTQEPVLEETEIKETETEEASTADKQITPASSPDPESFAEDEHQEADASLLEDAASTTAGQRVEEIPAEGIPAVEASATVETIIEEGSSEAPPAEETPIQHKPTAVTPTPVAPEQEDPQPAEEAQPKRGGLSLHSVTKISRLSSKNLRLIPGLEFAPLRRDEGDKLKIAPLVNESPPDFDEFIERTVDNIPAIPVPELLEKPELEERTEGKDQEETLTETDFSEVDSLANITERIATATEEETFTLPLRPIEHTREPLSMTPLEELARRLETARIPIVAESEEEHENPAFEPSIVSDTFAGILVRQGAYTEAIKAYQMLSRMKPESRDHYQQKIQEMRWKMSSVVDESKTDGEGGVQNDER